MTDAPALDERTHAAAIKALLSGPLNGHVYDYGDVPGADNNPGALPAIFALVSLERRYVEPSRAGRSGRSGWRLSVRYVGSTVNEARWAAAKVATALETNLTIGGAESTPITHESTSAIAADDGRFSGYALYTYAL